MKKLLKVFLVIFAISALLAVFAACEPDCKGNHEYGEWHETTATCTAGGRVGYYQCSVCGLYFDANHQEIAEEDLDVPALGHTFNKDNSSDLIAEVPATCTTEGVAAHFHCDRCNKNFGTDGTTELTSIVVPALGHTFGAWVEEVPATCLAEGTKGYKTCSVCEKNFDANGNEITDLTIAKVNHAFGAWVEEVPATCLVGGTKGYKTCSTCHLNYDAQGNVIDSLAIPALGHNYVENVCSNCQDELTEAQILDALFALESGEELPGTFKLTGTIVKVVSPWSEEYHNITVDILVGDKTVQCFRLVSTDEHDASTIALGQQITVVGGLTNYNGTKEFKSGCELKNVVVPSFSLGVTIEHGTTTALENTYPAGTRVSFKVTPDDGYKVESVTVNGTLILADDAGNYSFVIGSNTTVVVSLVEEGVVLDTVRIFNVSEIAAANNYENGTAYTPLDVTDTNLTIEALGGGNNGKFYTSNQSWRLYNGGTLKISVASGFELVSVKVTFTQGTIGSLVSGESYAVAATEKSSVSFDATATTHVTEIMVVYRATCQHVWNEGEVTTQPTCTEAGVTTFTCTSCGETKTENVPAALGHTYNAQDWIAEVPATCTENGTKGHFHCTRCNKDFDAENNEIANLTITAPGHTYGAWVDEVPATCTENGTKGHKTCSVCGKHFDADGNEIANLTLTALGHDYGAWTPDEVVAENPATHSRVCANDASHTETKECQIGTEWKTSNAKHWHECSVCGRRVDEAEHVYDAETGDCECGNNIRPVVTVYNEVETKFETIVAAFAYAMENYSAENPVVISLKNDLSGTGVKVVAASPVNVVLDLGGHTYTVDGGAVGSTGYESQGFHFELGSKITIKNGTLTSVSGSGVKMLLQNYCALTLDNVVADGTHLDGVKYTSSNNFGSLTLKNGSQIIAAEGGVAFDCWYGMNSSGLYDDGVAVVVEEGCTINGVIEYGASSRVSGTEWTAKASISLPAGDYTIRLSSAQEGLDCTTANVTIGGTRISHFYGEWIEEDPATCTEEGVKAHFHCSCCGKNFNSEKAELASIVIAALGHNYGEWIEEVPSTCTEEGTVAHFHCDRCGKNFNSEKAELESITIAKIAHNYEAWVDEVPATCLAEGTKGHQHCTLCDKNYDKNNEEIPSLTIAKLDHVFGDVVEAQDANCTEAGNVEYRTCSTCYLNYDAEGVVIENVVIPALGHNCVENVCSVCEHEMTEQEILDALFALEKDASLKGTYKLTGTIVKVVSAWNEKFKNITVDILVGDETVQCFRLVSTDECDASTLAVGYEITVTGVLKNFNGTKEFDAACKLVSVAKPTYTVSVTIENGTTDLGTSYEAGTTVTFKVTPDSGYKVGSVTVNGDVVLPDGEDNYSFVIAKNTEVIVEIVDDSAIVSSYVVMQYTGATTGNMSAEGNAEKVNLDKNIFTVTAGKTGNNYPGLNKAGDIRLYAGTDTCWFEISINSNYEIVSIQIELASTSEVTIEKVHIIVDGTPLESNSTGRYDINSGSVRISSNATKQYRIAKITIEYRPACDHVWNEGEVTKEASCTEAGARTYTCTLCGKTKVETLEKAPHTYEAWVDGRPATCTEEGTQGYQHCTLCNKNYDKNNEEIASLTLTALGHNYGELIEEVPATCTAEGTLEHFHCDRCGKNFSSEKAELESITIAKKAHTYGDWNNEIPATCTENGTKGYKDCSVCGKHFDADGNEIADLTLTAPGHTFGALVAEVPATCTENGTKGHKDCSVCGKHFDADGNEIADLTLTAPGHTYGAWNNEIPATCTTDGTKGYKDCSVCGKHFDAEGNVIEDLTIAALGHTYNAEEDWIAEKLATCEDPGTKGHFHCTRCEKDFDEKGIEIDDLTLAALGHNYEGQPYLPATENRHYQECKNDSSESHRKYEACNISGWCSDNEQHWHECTVCGQQYDVALHTFVDGLCECGVNSYAVSAVIGETTQEFQTLPQAFEFAMNNYSAETPVVISLKNDLSGTGVKVVAAKPVNVVLDLGGHTYTVDGGAVGSTGYESQGFHFEKGSVITIKNGTLTSVAGSGVKMLLQNYCALTLDNVVADGTHLDGVAPYTSSNNFGSLTLKNGSQIIAAEGGVAFDCWYGLNKEGLYDDGVAVVVGEGCTINGVIEYGASSRVSGTAWTEKASISLPAGNYTIRLSSAQEGLDCETANVTIGGAHIDHKFVSHACAICGTVETAVVVTAEGAEPKNFITLADAVAAVPADGKLHTLTLQYSIAGNGIKVIAGQNILIDLNSCTYTVNANTVGSSGTETNGFQLLKDSVVTFKNGTINTVAEANAKILIQNYCTLTLDNAILDGTYLTGMKYTSSNNFGSLTLKNGSQIIAAEGGVAFDCWYGLNSSGLYDDGVAVVVEEGCTINGVIEYGAQSRVSGTEWTAKASISLPAGEYTIRFSSSQEGLNCATANVTIGGAHIDHNYGEWTVTTPASCEVEGEKERTCSVCGTKEIATVEKLGHTWDNLQQVEGVVEGKVVHSYTCNVCEAIKYEECASDTWLSDDDNHWKVCDLCHKTFATAAHSYGDGTCDCGKKEPVAPSETVVAIDLTAQGYANEAVVSTVEKENVKLLFDKGTNSNPSKYYTSGTAVRMYGGNTLTVTAPAGKTISKIVITFGGSDGKNEITADVDSYDNGTWTGSASAVTFTVGGTSGNRRIQKVEVTYQ